MIKEDNTEKILTNHTNPRHQRSMENWSPYYITLAVWLVVQIAFYLWLSNHYA